MGLLELKAKAWDLSVKLSQLEQQRAELIGQISALGQEIQAQEEVENGA